MREIKLVNNKGRVIVDDDLYLELSKYSWYFNKGYATGYKLGLMHRYIMNTPRDLVVDHINRNKLDNRRCNLRNCTSSENNKNKPPFKKNPNREDRTLNIPDDVYKLLQDGKERTGKTIIFMIVEAIKKYIEETK